MWSDVRSTVDRRRREFRRTTNDFVQLVAVGLTTDQSVEEAIQFALGVGDSDMFELLRDELATAPLRGVPLWEAIDQLGRTFHQRELCEFAGSIERQGTQGVSITDTVNTLAVAMREKALDELEREADRANANLSGPPSASSSPPSSSSPTRSPCASGRPSVADADPQHAGDAGSTESNGGT